MLFFTTIISLVLISLVNCQTYGTIEVTIATASLQTNANAFADICIQNDATTAVSLPFKDRTLCGCQTKTVTNSSIPVWQTVCTSAATARYVSGARIVIEVWNQTTSTTTTLLGGVTIGVSQVISNGDNGKQVTLPIAGGTSTGNLIVKVVWTQIVTPPTTNFGYINVTLLSAEIATSANLYADVCLQNGSDTTAASLPVKNRTMCGCQTKTVSASIHPIWQQMCTSAVTNRWTNGTRVSVEVWDQLSTSMTNFIGGASLVISQLLTNGDNNKELPLALSGGSQSGKIWIQVQWTPAM